MKTKTSYVWQYFEEVDSDYAKCKICNKNFSRKGRTTTSLKGHLRSMHTEKYTEISQDGEQGDIVTVNRIQIAVTPLQQARRQNITEQLRQENEIMDTSQSKKIDDSIGEMIALDNLPFNFVEGIGFRRFIQTVSPNYELKGHQYYTDHIVDEMYGKIAMKIEKTLELFHKLSITMDIRSDSSTGGSLLMFTAHGITEDFDQRQVVLKCCLLRDHYTDDVICDQFTKTLLEWNIEKEQLHCVVHNVESSTGKVMHLTKTPSVSCTVHQLQLCVNSALESTEVKNLIVKCKEVTEHFSQSQIAKEELFKIQREQLDQPKTNVTQECDHRWNGTYHMVDQLLEIKDSICLYAYKHNIPQLSPEEWLTLDKIKPILSFFEELTTILTDTKTCISSVLPWINMLKDQLRMEKEKNKTNEDIVNIINKLIGEICVRFYDISDNILYALATYLDPRYKSKFFNEIEKKKVQSELLSLLMLYDKSRLTMSNVDYDGGDRDDDDEDIEPRFVAKRPKIEFVEINEEQSRNSYSQPTHTINSKLTSILKSDSEDDDAGNDSNNIDLVVLKALINEYNKEKRLKPDEDPILWWKHRTQFQAFLPIVLTYLSTPTGSFLNEQQSKESDTINESFINSLDSEKISKLLFVKYNLPLINFDYY